MKSANSGSSAFSTPSSARVPKRRCTKTSQGSGSDGLSHESNTEGRERLKKRKAEEKMEEGWIHESGLGAHFNEESNSPPSAELQEEFRLICREKYEKEEDLQNHLDGFLSKLFKTSKDLDCIDTHARPLHYSETIRKNSRKPDFTIVPKNQHFGILAYMFVEIKTDLEVSESMHYYSAYGQLRDHASDLFYNDYCALIPRKVVWGLSTDCTTFYFYKFFVRDSKLRHCEYIASRQTAYKELWKIAHCYKMEPFELEFTRGDEKQSIDLIKSIHNVELLYKSSLSLVFSIDSYVLKTNASPCAQESIKNEPKIYDALSGKLDAGSNRAILTLKGERHDDDRKLSALLFEEKGTRLKSLSGVHQSLAGVVKLLKKLHLSGYVHRDIRPANLLRFRRDGEEGILLIDFGFACKHGEKTRYEGTLETASESVLEQLANGDQVTVNPEDDLESLVKTVIVLLFNDEEFAEPLRRKRGHGNKKTETVAKDTQEEWAKIKERFPVKHWFNEFWDIAKNRKYDELANKFNGFC